MQTTSAVRALGTLQISAWCMFSPFLSHPVVGEDCMILHRCVKTGWSGGPAILAKMLPSTFWHLCCWSRSAPENRREWRQRQRLRVNCQSSVYVCCFSSESNVTISEEAASQLAASKICKQTSKQATDQRSIDQSINPYQYNVLSRSDEALPPRTSSLPERVAEWCGQPWQCRSQAPTRVKSMCRKSSYQFLVVRLVQTSSQFGFVTWRPLQTEKLAIRTSTSGATTGCNRPTDCVKTCLSFFDATDCYCYCLKDLLTLLRIEQKQHCLARKLVVFQ